MSIAEIVERYASQTVNARTGRVQWGGGRTSNVRVYGPIIYSYGLHHPLAVMLGPGLFLKNGDRVTVSTARHLAEVQRACEGPTVSFRALRAAGVEATALTLSNVLEWAPDKVIDLVRDSEDQPWEDRLRPGVPFKRPSVGMLMGRGTWAQWHILGAVLLKIKRPDLPPRYLLCSLDEGSYFVADLRGKPRTLADAYADLKPAPVRAAEAAGRQVERQGEWFFVPLAQPPAGRSHAQRLELPRRDPRSNRHVVRGLQVKAGRTLVTGYVRHWEPGRDRSTRQHRALLLPGWYEAFRNTERASWQVVGRGAAGVD